MAESEKELIKADELRFTWWTGIGTGLTALVSGIAVVADRLTSLNLDPQLMQALILFAAVGAIATAIVVSVDVLARAWVTVADKRALPGNPPMLLGKGTA